MAFRRIRVLGLALIVASLGAGVRVHAQCGPMDVVFVIDNSGSMQPVIDQVKLEVGKIADAVTTASGGDYQFGLVTMPANNVNIALDMAPKNRAALDTAVQAMTTDPSNGLGIAYDEALDAVLNHLGPRTGAFGAQTGTFTASFRPGATKIIMIITDTGPQGFDAELLGHADHAYSLATAAANDGIRIAGIFVPDGGGTDQTVDEPILAQVAGITGGAFKETAPDASDLASVIVEIVETCGAGGGTLTVNPQEIAISNGESVNVKVTNYRPGDLKTLVYTSSGLPADSTVTFTTIPNPEFPGTNQQTMRITIGPDTQAGVYIVDVGASHTGASGSQHNFVLVNVDCRPPLILGTGQPGVTTLGNNVTVNPVGSLGLHYQWYRGSTGSTAFPVGGATGASFKPTEAGKYWVRITNACGSTDSFAATVN
jgi:hypothetical protein